jgi:hypothetical protein
MLVAICASSVETNQLLPIDLSFYWCFWLLALSLQETVDKKMF